MCIILQVQKFVEIIVDYNIGINVRNRIIFNLHEWIDNNSRIESNLDSLT